MGVDIRLHTEISYNGKDWQHSGGFRPDRHYDYFGVLHDGIRGSNISGLLPKGLPEDVTPKTLSDWGFFSEIKPDARMTWGEAFTPKWLKKSAGGAYYPDIGVFGASYLSLEEFDIAVKYAHSLDIKNVEYESILEYMRKLGEEYQVRVVYFFDN